MIREHGFFEGRGARYRNGPARLARLLQLAGDSARRDGTNSPPSQEDTRRRE
jgi:hypothetical protein